MAAIIFGSPLQCRRCPSSISKVPLEQPGVLRREAFATAPGGSFAADLISVVRRDLLVLLSLGLHRWHGSHGFHFDVLLALHKPGNPPMPFDGKRMIFGGFELVVEVKA